MKFTDWKKHFELIGNKLNSNCKVIHHLSGGMRQEFFSAIIEIEYLKNKLTIQQGFTRYDYESGNPNNLILTYKFHNQSEFNLTIYEREFFEKLFNSNRILTKNKEFDKKFTLKSSGDRKALKIFENIEIQKFFLENRLMTFRIETEQFETEIKLNYLGKLNYENGQVESIVTMFEDIISKVIN